MPRQLAWFPEAWEDYLYWQMQDKKTLERINLLLKTLQRNPFLGAGKPEPLGKNFAGCWSRRVDHKNRLVYKVEDASIVIISCRYHYGDK